MIEFCLAFVFNLCIWVEYLGCVFYLFEDLLLVTSERFFEGFDCLYLRVFFLVFFDAITYVLQPEAL